jgi:ABC-type amino acid transport/signal transduction systems, periplasmic component/domain
MNSRKIRTISVLTAMIFLFGLILSGCSAKNSTAENTAAQAANKIKITVATGGQPKPFSYVDANNQITGYDIDVVKAIFQQLPQYDVSFEKTEFTSIFAGLDSDRYQIGANNFAMNEQRKQKYIYTNPIFKNQFVIAVAADRTDINSFKDLQGKTTEVQAGVNYTTALENYNKDHSDKSVKLNYSDADMVTVLQHVENGKYDFQLIDGPMLNNYIKEFGLKLKSIPLNDDDTKLIGSPYSYLLLSKGANGEQLEKDINATLDKLRKDGTISQISQKYFSADYSPK